MTHRVPLIVAAFAAVGLFAQEKPAFDVASVKPATRGGSDFRTYPGGRLHIANLPLDVIIRQAYAVKHYQLTGGPSWLHTDEFDIEAKAVGEPSRAQMMAMLQTLLADRFQLKVHRETREQNIYALTVAKNGPKLTPSTAAEFFIRLDRNTPRELPGVDYTIAGQKATLAQIAEGLGDNQLDRPVLDRTGIPGEFDFKLRYAIDDNPDTGPSIFAAIQEQLGLKLEAARGPVAILVIEKAEKPSGN
ncbi:MAG: TIGR03435 family protein [Candidatus Sulfopaludibacter sp.]|nr:TIGR03435 family protein [Candidatus Sulfopaludibacter sp.]